MDHGWLDVDWMSDAQMVIKQVVDGVDPCGWETRNELLVFNSSAEIRGWSYKWIPRSANLCADAAAKWARHCKCNIEIFNNFAVFLPPAVLSSISGKRSADLSPL